jgi:ectoine hydroxylase-related dioxygenase (phytanoyl-CoA dioxygenase family)
MSIFAQRELSSAETFQYQELGYVNFGSVAEGASLAEICVEADRIWESLGRRYNNAVSWNENALANGVHKESSVLRDLLYRSALPDIMVQLIGPNVKLASNQLVFKQPGDMRPYSWHQDNGFGPLDPENNVTCWMALDVTNERNGCIWVLPGSHKSGRLTHRQERGRERIAQIDDEQAAVPVRMKAGECLLFHGNLLHMSKANETSRIRRAFFFRYADADAIEILTGQPRIGRLLRGTSKFPEVRECSELVCQPDKNEFQAKNADLLT